MCIHVLLSRNKIVQFFSLIQFGLDVHCKISRSREKAGHYSLTDKGDLVLLYKYGALAPVMSNPNIIICPKVGPGEKFCMILGLCCQVLHSRVARHQFGRNHGLVV